MCDYLEPSLPYAYLYRDDIPFGDSLLEATAVGTGKQQYVLPRFGEQSFIERGLYTLLNQLRASTSKSLQFSIREFVTTAIGRSVKSYTAPSWSILIPGGEADDDEQREHYREFFWYIHHHTPHDQAPVHIWHLV